MSISTESVEFFKAMEEAAKYNSSAGLYDAHFAYFKEIQIQMIEREVKLINNKPGFIIDKTGYSTTFGKYIRRRLRWDSQDLSDKALDYFVNSTMSKLIDPELSNVKLLTGDDIMDFYQSSEYHSCMTGNSSYKTKIYSNNKDVVSLAVLDNVSRALLWTCIDGKKVLDRIYPAGSKKKFEFQKWAENNNILLRHPLDLDKAIYNGVSFVDNSTRIVSLKTEFLYPYFDTFKYGRISQNEKYVLLSNNENFGNLVFTDTSGSFETRHFCNSCNCKIPGGHESYINCNYYCQKCVKKFPFCDICGNRTPENNVVEVDKPKKCFCKACASYYLKICKECSKATGLGDSYLKKSQQYCYFCSTI